MQHNQSESMSPKQIFKRYFDNREAIVNSRVGGWLGQRLHDPGLWHFGRRTVAGGVGLGFFLAFVPVPMHMVLAVPIAIALRVNLPVAVGSVWIANPLTIPPMFLFALKLGMWLTGDADAYASLHFEHSFHGLGSLLSQLWLPLVVGCLVCAMVASATGNFAVRWGWRYYLLRRRQQRRQARALKQS